jgi:nucleotide-binding universal stress UspA family protein
MTARSQPGPVPDIKVKRILFPTDFSPGTEPAARWVEALRRAFGAEVVILHVLDLSLAGVAGMPTEMAAMPAVGELLERARAETAEEMARVQQRFPEARTMVREGSPRPMILQVAADVGADLIVMGTRGRSGLAHVLFGSVAEHVVRHSPIPVLTVRETEPV